VSDQRDWRLVLARTVARRGTVPASVRRFARRARRRRLRTALPWLITLLVLVVAGSGAAVVYETALFGVGTVKVVGFDAAQVRLAAAVPHGTPLARVDLGAVARRVESYPPVLTATVHRSWPRTLVVDVTPRVAVAVVEFPGSYGLIDAHGVVFAQVKDRSAAGGRPLVELPQPHPDDLTTRSALSVLASLNAMLRDRLVAVVAEAPARIRLELTGALVVVWGDATDNAAKVKVATQMLSAPGGAGGSTLDVSAPNVVAVR
jgi:cell division protein FtsQ